MYRSILVDSIKARVPMFMNQIHLLLHCEQSNPKYTIAEILMDFVCWIES